MADHCGRKVIVSSAIGNALNQLALTLIVVLFLTAIPGAIMAAEEKSDGKRARGSWLTEAGFISGYGDASLGVGLYRSLTKNVALNPGYRHRHVSNADLKKPNKGIDSEIALLGLSYFF